MKSFLTTFTLCMFFLFSCKKTDTANNTPPTPPITTTDSVVLRPHVYVVDSTKMKLNTSAAVINSGKFEFTINSFTPTYKVGDIIVVETNGGCLRKITGIENSAGKVLYTTTGSSMSQVFEKGAFSFNLNSDSLRVVHRGYTLDLNNITVYQQGPLSIKLTSGNINFDPDWNFDFDFNSNGIQKFQMGCTNAFLNGSFDLTVSATQSTSLINRIDTVQKLTKSFTKWIVVGGIPVPVIVQMDVRFLVRSDLNINAAITRRINISTNNTFSVGMKYENSQWNGIYNFTPTTNFTLTQSTNIAGFTYNFYLYPEVSVKLYNVAGPYASIAFRSQIVGNKASPSLDWDQSIKAWLETTVGANVSILGNTLANYSKTWSTDSLNYNAPDSIVKVSGDNQTGQPNLYLTQPVKVKVVDTRGKPQTQVPVYFTVTNGGGSLQYANVLTDTNGIAQTNWKLGTQVTIQKLEAKSKKANGTLIQNAPIEFAATIGSITVLTTSPICSVTQISAVSGGYITDDGGSSITSRGICWSSGNNPTIANNITSDGSGLGNFISNISGLSANTQYYLRAYATNSIGTIYGNEISFKTQPSTSITVSDIDGNIYHAVTIGTQVWMTENLKTTRYRNGNPITYVTNGTTWKDTTAGAYCFYNNNPLYDNPYGKLYNGFAVSDSRNIAPLGWHVPSAQEFVVLRDFYGGSSIAGNYLKEAGTTHWSTPNSGTNCSGFTALPTPFRSYDGGFEPIGNIHDSGFWWASTQSSIGGTIFYLSSGNFQFNGDSSISNKRLGVSIRCIKD